MRAKKARQMEGQIRRLSARFPRLIEWSDEDRCIRGQRATAGRSVLPRQDRGWRGDPAGDHRGRSRARRARRKDARAKGEPKKTYSGKFVLRIPTALHKKIALKAQARGESLNQYVVEVLTET